MLSVVRNVLISISTSGNLMNIINAINIAKKLGIEVVALTGCSSWQMKLFEDISISIPSQAAE